MPEDTQDVQGDGETGSLDVDPNLDTNSFLGKLQTYCPNFFMKLSLWERDFLVLLFRMPALLWNLGTVFLRGTRL
jgi:hypothetical protein